MVVKRTPTETFNERPFGPGRSTANYLGDSLLTGSVREQLRPVFGGRLAQQFLGKRG